MVWPYHPIESRSKLNIIRDSRPTLNFHRDRVENDWPSLDSIKIFSTAIQKFHPLYDTCTRICVSYAAIHTFVFIYSFERVFNSGHWIEVRSPTVYINTPPYEFPIEKIRTVTRRKIVMSFCLLPIFFSSLKSTGFRGILFFFLFMVEKYTYRNRNRDIFQLSANIPLLLKGTDLLDFFLDGRNVCISSKG